MDVWKHPKYVFRTNSLTIKLILSNDLDEFDNRNNHLKGIDLKKVKTKRSQQIYFTSIVAINHKTLSCIITVSITRMAPFLRDIIF